MDNKPSIALLVDSPQTSIAFYTNLPGFHVHAYRSEGDTAEIVALDGTRYLLARASAANKETLQRDHEVIYEPGETLRFAANDLEVLRAQLKTHLEVEENASAWGNPILVVRDPDGYSLEFADKVHLSQEKTFSLYQQGIDRLRDVLKGLTSHDFQLTGESEDWSIQQLVHHICDGDAIWSMTIKAALGNSGCEYSHDWYVNDRMLSLNLNYAGQPVDTVVDLFVLQRLHILQMIQIIPGSWERYVLFRKGTEERAKKLTVEVLLRMRAMHTLEHIEDVHAILRKHKK